MSTIQIRLDGAAVARLEPVRLRAGIDHFDGENLAVDHPLCGMPNVVLTPHIGGATYDTEANHTMLMATGLKALLAGEVPSNLANPEVLG